MESNNEASKLMLNNIFNFFNAEIIPSSKPVGAIIG